MDEKNPQESIKKLEKERRIKKEILKLKKIYKNLSKEKTSKIMELIYRASFLLVMAQDMEKEINDCDSFTSTIINATQTYIKTNPLLKDYRDTVKSYQAVLKQLNDFTKDELPVESTDELSEWNDK